MANVITDTHSLSSILDGAKKVADLLRPNYGPDGRNTIYDQTYDIPLIINEGKQILSELSLTDQVENMGAVILRDAALGLAARNGDGTTATIIMASALLQEGRKLVTAGVNPMKLRAGIRKYLPLVEKAIRDSAVPVEGQEAVERIAVTSADDEETGRLVAGAFEALGVDGVITVTDSQEPASRLEVIDGVRYDYGFFSSAFINREIKRDALLERPYVLVADEKIESLAQIGRILTEVIQKRAALLMITRDMTDEVVRTICANVHRYGLKIVAATGPGHGESRRRNMQAIAEQTGAVLVEENCGLTLSDCGLEICGQVEQAVISKEMTQLTGLKHPDSPVMSALRQQVSAELEQAQASGQDEVVERLNITRSILEGKMAVLVAGGITEYEMFERKHRMENTVHAVRAALKGGCVAGGGKSYFSAALALEQCQAQEEEERFSLLCLKKALMAPTLSIADNAGDHGAQIVSVLSDHANDPYFGYNARTHRFEDIRQNGIWDPADTVVLSFLTAANIAATLLTVDAAVVA